MRITKKLVETLLQKEQVLTISLIRKYDIFLNDDLKDSIEEENPDYANDVKLHIYFDKNEDWVLFWYCELNGRFYIEFYGGAISETSQITFLMKYWEYAIREGEELAIKELLQ